MFHTTQKLCNISTMKFYLLYDVFILAGYFILINNPDIIFDVKSHIRNNNKHIANKS